MPRRILPNTDKLRYQTLKQCIDKLADINPQSRFLSEDQYHSMLSVMSRFEQIFLAREKLKADPEYLAIQKKAGLFLKHYLMVMQMAALRGEMPEKNLMYYGLKNAHSPLPAFNTGKQIIELGSEIFEADAKRIANGGKYITMPGIAVVKIWYDKFVDAYQNHRVQVEKYKNNQEFVQKLRNEVTRCIIEFWNSLEYEYNHLEPESFRQLAMEYGLQYSLSSNEIALEASPKTASLFNPEEIPVDKLQEQAAKYISRPKPKYQKKQVSELQTSFPFLSEEIETDKGE
ncbi:MAG: hypothetical protein PF448_03010 [Bacteroidales bacterium]|jgi:hypothetical protein|nr:hypothetical protein [Bacteroidales bacterium]